MTLARFLTLASLLVSTATPAIAAEPAPDYTWMNGTNYQTTSPLTSGPLTWMLMVDTYYGYSFNRPADHTIFPTTTAPRHNEFNLNLATLGLEVTEYKHLFGKLVFQAGNYVDTITGTDTTVQRGAYSSLGSLRHVQQAYAGHRFDVWSGMNLVMGLFPAFIGLDSYIPQENWNYTHNLLSDFTPYYLMGLMAQVYPRPDLKTEVWLVNGWQSLSKHGEGMGLGYSINWRPSDRLSLTHNVLGGNFEADQSRTRLYTDNTVQWKYALAPFPGVEYLAIAAAVDYGYNTGSSQPGGLPGTPLGGAALLHRTEFNPEWGMTQRVSFFDDPQKLVALSLPGGQSVTGGLTAYEATATLDYRPSAWMLYRLEYRHDRSNVPYIAGPGGIAGPPGSTPDLRTSGDRLTANATVRF